MFVEKDILIVNSQSSNDSTIFTRLGCVALCMRNNNCRSVSYTYYDLKCRIETAANFSKDHNIGAVTLSFLQGMLVLYKF